MSEAPFPNPDAEARARVEADVTAALQESFAANADHVQISEDGTEHLTLFVQPNPSIVAQVDVSRSSVDERGGGRTTTMLLTPLARVSESRRGGIRLGNGGVHANVWRLTEFQDRPSKFETGTLDQDGSFLPTDDELMASDETVASFGRYWPANLRQGSPENPLRKSRGLGRLIGRTVLKGHLPALQHRNYYQVR